MLVLVRLVFVRVETTVDLSKGIINMPCLNVDGEYFDVEMSQRGNSSNWKVTGLKNNKEKHRGTEKNRLPGFKRNNHIPLG